MSDELRVIPHSPSDMTTAQAHRVLDGVGVDALARAEHDWCVEVEGEFALQHQWQAHQRQAAYILSVVERGGEPER